MGLLTNFLELFKYDPSADGDSTFNIETALNENWDKIDAKAKTTEESLNNHKGDATIHHTVEAIQDVVGGLIQAGSNVSVTYDDQNNQIQISSNYIDTNTQRSDEEIRDITAAFIKAGTNVSISHDDTGNELTITADLTASNILAKLKTVDGYGSGLIVQDSGNLGDVDASYFKGRNAGSSSADPNTTASLYILSNHANSPDSSKYWHIRTQFYSSVTNGANRAQIAIGYNTVGAYVRYCYSDVWSAWRRLDNYGTDTNVNTSGAEIIDYVNVEGGIVTSMGKRNLTPANIGALAVGATASNSDKVDGKHASGTLATSEKLNLVTAINELFTDVDSGKNLVASAITDKGVATSGSDTFATMASNIGNIESTPQVTAGSNWLMTLASQSSLKFGGYGSSYTTHATLEVNVSGSLRFDMVITEDSSNNRGYRILKNGGSVATTYAQTGTWVVDLAVQPGDTLVFQGYTEGGSSNFDSIDIRIAENPPDVETSFYVYP